MGKHCVAIKSESNKTQLGGISLDGYKLQSLRRYSRPQLFGAINTSKQVSGMRGTYHLLGNAGTLA